MFCGWKSWLQVSCYVTKRYLFHYNWGGIYYTCFAVSVPFLKYVCRFIFFIQINKIQSTNYECSGVIYAAATVVSAASSQLEGPQSESTCWLWPFWVEFACSPVAWVSSRDSRVSSHWYARLIACRCGCEWEWFFLCVCLHMSALRWTGDLSRMYPHPAWTGQPVKIMDD